MNNTLKFLISGFMMLTTASVYAQIGPPPPSGGVPVDGGVGFLVAAGAMYGAKKLRDSRMKKQQENQDSDSVQP